LDEPAEGEIRLKDRELHSLTGKSLAAFRNRHIGFVFQFHHLLPEFTALENVCIPAWISGGSKSVAEARAKELLETLGVAHRMKINLPPYPEESSKEWQSAAHSLMRRISSLQTNPPEPGFCQCPGTAPAFSSSSGKNSTRLF